MKKIIDKIIYMYHSLSIVAKATLWFFVCNVLQNGIAIITVPIFTRMLSTSEYGIVTSYSAWLSIIMIFTSLRLNYGVFNKGMSKYGDRKNEYSSTMLILTSMTTSFFFCIYIIFHKYFNTLFELPTAIVIVMFIDLFFAQATIFWSLQERYEFRYKRVVKVTLLMSFLNPIIGIISIYATKHPAYARIVSGSCINIIFGAIIYIYIMRKSKAKFVFEYAKFAVFFNIPLIPHYLSEYILEQSDRVMIQKMCSKTELGLYGVAYNAGSIVKILVSSLNSALIPWIYKSFDKNKFDAVYKRIPQTCTLLVVPIMMFMAVAPELLKLLAPPQYAEVVYVIPPVAASVYFIYLIGIYGNVEFYWDKNKFTMYVSVISAVVNVILNFIAIPYFGYIAAAYTTVICYALDSILHVCFIEKISREKIGRNVFNEKYIWLNSLIFIIYMLCICALYNNYILRYSLLFVLGVGIICFRDKLKGIILEIK